MDDEFKPGILGDLRRLQKTIAEDFSGDEARAMLAHFEGAAEQREKQLRTTRDDGDREHLSQFIEGCRASQRLIRQAWERAHSAALLA